MKDFIEKWNTDSRFKAKVKLGVSTLFVVIVSIFAFSTYNPTDVIDNNDDNLLLENKSSIEIPDEYNYTINISINENNYQYTGNKTQEEEHITKLVDNTTYNYIYKDNSYYQDSIGINNLVDKDEIYDIISYNYLDLETINKYLSISTKEENQYLVYLKDIILGNDSEEYITISLETNKVNINYTSLMKLFDKTIESCQLEVIIE